MRCSSASALSAPVARISVLRSRELLGLGTGSAIIFFDPEARAELQRVVIPAAISMD